MTLTWSVSTLELARPFRISRAVMSARQAVTVVVTDPRTGLCGRGEVVTSVHANVDVERIEAELAETGLRWGSAQPGSDAALRGVHPAVAAAVWSAIAELAAVADGVSVAAHLGLPLPAEVPIARTVGIEAPEVMATDAADLVGRGFGLLKVKTDGNATESVRRLTAVAAAAPGTDLIVDPNEAWTVATAASVLDALHGVPIVGLEQPLPSQDRNGIRELRSRTEIPIIADEAIHDLADLDALAGLVDAVNIKLPKCAGVYRARDLAIAARDRGLDVMLGCLVSSSLGIAPAVHLASLARWCDLDGHLLLAWDPWTGLGGANGTLRPNGRPGLGVHRSDNEDPR